MSVKLIPNGGGTDYYVVMPDINNGQDEVVVGTVMFSHQQQENVFLPNSTDWMFSATELEELAVAVRNL